MMALGSLECSRPSAWPSSCTATRKRSFPAEGETGGARGAHLGVSASQSVTSATPGINSVSGPEPDTATYREIKTCPCLPELSIQWQW